MSDEKIRSNDLREKPVGSDLEATPGDARLRWLADLVCAILNAENAKKSPSTVMRSPRYLTDD